jgi:putative ABC transport system permease protein
MRIAALFKIAFRSLARNKLRSVLTMLGIVIGVAAVIAMLAVGQGARDSVESSIASLGTNVIIIFPGALTQGGINNGAGSSNKFTEADVDFLRRADAVAYVSPMVRNTAQIKAGGQNWRTSIYGVYP